MAQLDAQASSLTLADELLSRGVARVGAQLDALVGGADGATATEQAAEARDQALQDARSALLLHTELEPKVAYHLLS